MFKAKQEANHEYYQIVLEYNFWSFYQSVGDNFISPGSGSVFQFVGILVHEIKLTRDLDPRSQINTDPH